MDCDGGRVNVGAPEGGCHHRATYICAQSDRSSGLRGCGGRAAPPAPDQGAGPVHVLHDVVAPPSLSDSTHVARCLQRDAKQSRAALAAGVQVNLDAVLDVVLKVGTAVGMP